MKIDKDVMEDVLKQEVLYHENDRGNSGASPDWEEGFLAGLTHCLYLVNTINDLEEPDEDLEEVEDEDCLTLLPLSDLMDQV